MGILNVDWSAREPVSTRIAFIDLFRPRIAKAIQNQLVGYVLRSWKGGYTESEAVVVVMSSVSTQKGRYDVHIHIGISGFPFWKYRNDLFTGAVVRLSNLEVEGDVFEQKLNDNSECVFPSVPKGRYCVVFDPVEEQKGERER